MTKKSALFLDRDGTIIEDQIGGYIRTIEQVTLIPEAAASIAQAKSAGFLIVVVSNQSGIAKGIVSKAKVDEINAYMQSELKKGGGEAHRIYYAPYHPEYPKVEFEAYKSWRKPETGMIEQAVLDFQKEDVDIDLSSSYFIGDKQIDIECGKKAKVKTILVKTGYSEFEACVKNNTLPDFVAENLAEGIRNFVLISNNAFHGND
ncbi:MAG: HAD family hydrolase [Chloroherpetonaceae bacterium]|nr:HAD family hydrolase [Chloroherpetonaceae bacterium]